MKTSQAAAGAFAILKGVYGLPSLDPSIGSQLAKRDLPYPLDQYEQCLDNKFKDSFNEVTPWGGCVCDTNQEIYFYAEKVLNWASGEDCYKYGKENLREMIKNGDAQAAYEMSANGNLLFRCKVGVRTMPYPVNDYVECLNNEVRNSIVERNSWDDIICKNPKIKFTINGLFWINPSGCYDKVHDGLEAQLWQRNPHTYEKHWEGWLASCSIAVRTEF